MESDKLLQGFDLFAFVLGLLRQRAVLYFRSLASSGWDTAADAEIEVPYVDSRAVNGCTVSCCNTTQCNTVQPYIFAQGNVLL